MNRPGSRWARRYARKVRARERSPHKRHSKGVTAKIWKRLPRLT